MHLVEITDGEQTIYINPDNITVVEPVDDGTRVDLGTRSVTLKGLTPRTLAMMLDAPISGGFAGKETTK